MFSPQHIKISLTFFAGVCVGLLCSVIIHPLQPFVFHSDSSGIVLSFPIGGQLAFIAPVGTKVAVGDIVARLDMDASTTALEEAQTNLIIQQAKAAELAAVGDEQQTILKETQQSYTAEAKRILSKDIQNLVVALASEASSTQAAVQKTDILFTDPDTDNPELLIPTDTLSAAAAESGRVSISSNIVDLASLGTKAMMASSSPTQLQTIAQNSTADIAEIQLFLESLAFLEKQASTTSSVSATTLAAWQKGIATAETGISTVLQTSLTAQNALVYDQTAAENSSVASTTGILDSQLAAHQALQAAAVAQAESLASSTAASVAVGVLRAPTAGTIAAVAPKLYPGQSVTAGQPIVSLVSNP